MPAPRGKRFEFYHIKNLQSTKTQAKRGMWRAGFITLRIYKVLKQAQLQLKASLVLSH